MLGGTLERGDKLKMLILTTVAVNSCQNSLNCIAEWVDGTVYKLYIKDEFYKKTGHTLNGSLSVVFGNRVLL